MHAPTEPKTLWRNLIATYGRGIAIAYRFRDETYSDCGERASIPAETMLRAIGGNYYADNATSVAWIDDDQLPGHMPAAARAQLLEEHYATWDTTAPASAQDEADAADYTARMIAKAEAAGFITRPAR